MTRTYFPLPVLWQIKTFREGTVEVVVVDVDVVAVGAAPPFCLSLPWPLPGDEAAVEVDAVVPAAVEVAGEAAAASPEPPWCGLPLPGGGFATAIEATTPAANSVRNRIFSFMWMVSEGGCRTSRCRYRPKPARSAKNPPLKSEDRLSAASAGQSPAL